MSNSSAEAEEHPAEDILSVNDEEVKVNKHHLAYHSDYFERFFFGEGYKVNNKIVLDPPTNVEHFKRMLDTLEPVNRPLDDECIEGVWQLADQFFVREVKQKCSTFLAGESKHLAMFKYRLADKYGLATLKQQILDLPKKAFSECDDLDDFVENLEEFAKLDEPARNAMAICLQQKKMAPIAAFAKLIGVPIVKNLKRNYDKEKMLQLIKHGNGITKNLYIQMNQDLKGVGLLQSIVDLMISTERPEKMVGEVKIEPIDERNYWFFKWPQNEELKLKRKESNVAIKFNETSTNPKANSGHFLAEYELTNKRGCRFHLDFYYWREEHFKKVVVKFVYRRLA